MMDSIIADFDNSSEKVYTNIAISGKFTAPESMNKDLREKTTKKSRKNRQK